MRKVVSDLQGLATTDLQVMFAKIVENPSDPAAFDPAFKTQYTQFVGSLGKALVEQYGSLVGIGSQDRAKDLLTQAYEHAHSISGSANNAINRDMIENNVRMLQEKFTEIN